METNVATGGGTSTIGVLELGTNSLKLHLSKGLESQEPHRRDWDLGFEVFSTRHLSDRAIEGAGSQVRALLAESAIDPASQPVFGIATGAFRDAENTLALLNRLYNETGIAVQVLSVEEEALLLIEGARDLVPERPGMAFDLGGGSLEVIYFGAKGTWLREHLPLGANRLHHLALFASGVWDERQAVQWIDSALEHARPIPLAAVHGTGGTVRAISQVAGSTAVRIEDLRAIEDDARLHGAPAVLSERRRQLFLPGVMVVRRLAEHVGAEVLHYLPVDLGDVLLTRLHPFHGVLKAPLERSFLFQHLELLRTDGEGEARAQGPGAGEAGKLPVHGEKDTEPRLRPRRPKPGSRKHRDLKR